MSDELNTTLANAVALAEFAGRLAKRLLMFPLAPRLGDTWNDHAKALETSYTIEIIKALNEVANAG